MTASNARTRLADAGRRLTAEEADAWLSAPVTPEERGHVLALVRSTRRYPTPAEQPAYVRRATPRWRIRHA